MSRKLIILALFILIVIIVAAVTVFMLPQNGSVQPKAVIVDNLALMPHASSNHDFVKNATKILNEVGMDVDYFLLDDVTVNLYRNLGSYLIVILRTHSGMCFNVENKKYETYLFTSEGIQKIGKYSQYLGKNKNYLGNACIPATGECFIAVSPSFIRDFSENFHDSVIIAMGCESLKTTALAEAFIAKGASVFIGWTREVTPEGTDNATLQLLRRFFIENKTVSMAVNGLVDKSTWAKLDFYPDKAANLKPFSLVKKLIVAKASFSIFLINQPLIFNGYLFVINLGYRRLFRKF